MVGTTPCTCDRPHKTPYSTPEAATQALTEIRAAGGITHKDGTVWMPQEVYRCSEHAYHLTANTTYGKAKQRWVNSAKRRRLAEAHAAGLHRDFQRARCRSCIREANLILRPLSEPPRFSACPCSEQHAVYCRSLSPHRYC